MPDNQHNAVRADHESPANQSSTAGEKVTGLVLVAAVVSAISSLLYGYDTGIISGALLQIKKDFHIGSEMQQVIAAAILLGAVLGAFVGSRLSERRGRHLTVLILALIPGAAAALAALGTLFDTGHSGRGDIITLTLLTIINGIGAGPTMWLYAAFNVAAFVFVWRRMPELTGRSLEQIEGQLHRGKFRPKDFARLPANANAAEGATQASQASRT